MTTGKTTKVVDKLIADEWKRVLIPVQHMFPNCQVKYKTKCTNMKTCDKDEVKEGFYNYYKAIVEIENELILHNVNGYKIDPKRDKVAKKPKGFEDHTPLKESEEW